MRVSPSNCEPLQGLQLREEQCALGGLRIEGCEKEAYRFLERNQTESDDALPKKYKRAMLPLTLEVPCICSLWPQHSQGPGLHAEYTKLWVLEG